jgi:branched-chain amino acid transport system substrate-binding protein
MKRAALVLFLLVLAGCASGGIGPIKIGVIAPLTGNLANTGQEVRLGLEIARDEINAAGGVNGRQVRLIFEDGKCDPKEATTAARKLVDIDGVSVILGGVCTGESMAVATVINESKVVQLSALTSGSVYSDTGEWTFRTNPVDNSKVMVDYLFRKGYKTFGLISEQTAFSQSIRNDFKKWAQSGGGTIVADENFESTETDFRSRLLKLKDNRAQAYFLNTNSGPVGVSLARQAKELEIWPLYASRGYELADPAQFPGELDGIIFYGTAGVVDMNTPQAQRLFTEFEKRAGKMPQCAFCAASPYDDLMLIAAQIKECGEDAYCIKERLYSMPNYEGVIGTFTFDNNGDPQGIVYTFSQFKDGKVVPLAD